MAGLLWPDHPEPEALANLRQALRSRRTAIGDDQASPPFLIPTRTTLAFNPESDYWLDVAAFDAALSETQSHDHSRLESCPLCARRLKEAANLYRGDFLQGFSLDVVWLDRTLEGLCLFYNWGSHYVEGEAACRKATDRLSASADEAASANRLRVLAYALAWQGEFNNTLGRGEVMDRCWERALAALDLSELRDPMCDVRRERAFILRRVSWKIVYDDPKKTRQLAEASLELYRALGDRQGMAEAHLVLGQATHNQGDSTGVKQQFEESLSLLHAVGDRWAMIWPLIWLSWTSGYLGQIEEAERAARESVAIAHQAGDRVMVEWANRTLCDAFSFGGRFAEAQSLREENLAFSREQGARGMEAWGMRGVAWDATHLGAYEKARAAAQTVVTLSQEAGQQGLTASAYWHLGLLALAKGAYDDAQVWLQQVMAFYQQAGKQRDMGPALTALAYAARGLGQSTQARAHLRAALRIVVETRQFGLALESLSAMALLLMDGGEVERAVELYALGSLYPFAANSRWFEDVAGKHIAAAAGALPPDAVEAAQERRRTRDLWATVDELLAKLSTDE